MNDNIVSHNKVTDCMFRVRKNVEISTLLRYNIYTIFSGERIGVQDGIL